MDQNHAIFIIKIGGSLDESDSDTSESEMDADDDVENDDAEDDDNATASPGKHTGVCVKWLHEKGFGFIKRDDGQKDLFVHSQNCSIQKGSGYVNIRVGSKVEFNVES